MKIFKDRKPKIDDPATKPLEDKEPDSVIPAEEASEQTKEETSEPEGNKCGNCNGEGLIWHDGAKRHELCPVCFGKGKIN